MTSGSSVFGDADAVLDAFEQVPLLAVILDGPDLIVAACNAGLRASVGNRALVGLPFRDAFPELVPQQWFDMCDQVLATGEAFTGEEYRIHYLQPSGSYLEVYLDFSLVPWRHADGTLRGVIGFGSDVTERLRARRVVEEELKALRVQFEQARAATLATQRALLPDTVPIVPTLDVAARYVLAADEQAAGGDWFDVVTRADGTTTLVVGDVVGHGTSAAAAMGQLRAVMLAQLHNGASVGEALQQLDVFARSVPAARSATVCVVQIEGATGWMTYCCAGHPPPLVLPVGDGTAYFLDQGGAGPLATGASFEVTSTRLDVGATVVLYTDGLIERPGVPLRDGQRDLQRVATDARNNVLMPANASSNTVDRVCELSIELLTRAAGVGDDITMLAACRRDAVPAFMVTAAADDGLVIAATLGELRQWLVDLGTGALPLTAVMQAVTELVDNVVDHAYGEVDGGSVAIRAMLGADGMCRVEVADHGQWREPVATVGRGLGLALVRRLADTVDIESDDGGTTVRIDVALNKPAGLLDIAVARRDHDDDFRAEVTDDVGRTLVIRGVVDARVTGELDAQIDLTLTSAGLALLIDLSGVTLLASAGVHLLRRAVGEAARVGGEVVLYAPIDSPAQQVLAMTATPHITERA